VTALAEILHIFGDMKRSTPCDQVPELMQVGILEEREIIEDRNLQRQSKEACAQRAEHRARPSKLALYPLDYMRRA